MGVRLAEIDGHPTRFASFVNLPVVLGEAGDVRDLCVGVTVTKERQLFPDSIHDFAIQCGHGVNLLRTSDPNKRVFHVESLSGKDRPRVFGETRGGIANDNPERILYRVGIPFRRPRLRPIFVSPPFHSL